MQIIRDPDALDEALAALREDGGTIAFVPTMGALHAGHMALVAGGRRRADHVVASIFVNPTQFGANEDLAIYPRREAADAAMLEQEGCAILWAPDVIWKLFDMFIGLIQAFIFGLLTILYFASVRPAEEGAAH